ncbi:helix-turn-helix domain-containing protein [Bailinhaonella thermotolerans]|uniref:XRE family transcriptional regulator n=1 Tax=Bailinhaonella thermotolerans TaxID=1070861 RepID=A0A3A4AWN7_9ACTN|nr:helix-turn-helix transcriptional regulator [Bailinhaonella thermotolerans]RJL32707.1 XRE family transcriptional regulator [Bailinhaonella thermotolerans]
MVDTAPVLLRQRLLSELRSARRAAELTQEQVAEEMEWSISKIIRIERGSVGISSNDLKALLALYKVTDQRQVKHLLDLARGSRSREWWDDYRNDIDAAYLTYIGYEWSASRIRQFESMFVPGLLQTSEYARCVAGQYAGQDHEIDKAVRIRMRRQSILDRPTPPHATYILDEAVIRRHVGGPHDPGVMKRQLHHLVRLASRSRRVTIKVIPFAAGVHFGMRGPFTLLGFRSGFDEVLFLENQRPGLFADLTITGDDPSIRDYGEAFDALGEQALAPERSVEMIQEIADSIR